MTHQTPRSDDDPTVAHEVTQQLATVDVPESPTGDGTPSTPAGTTGEGVQADPPRDASAEQAPRDGDSHPGSDRPPTKAKRRRKIRELLRVPAEPAETTQPTEREAEPAAYSAAQEEIETDARRYLDAQHQRLYAAFVLLVTWVRIVEARGMLDRYVRNSHAEDPASVASWLLVRLGHDGGDAA